jgi:MoaA/NifB/PqqE/SkfB family radical SAM enzyme
MAVQHCIYPWHWLTLTPDGTAHPCPHGSNAVGNVCDNSPDEIWNGPVLQEVRASILAGKVHDICKTTNCPHQQPNEAFSPPEVTPYLDEEWAHSFDEDWYLENHPDVAAAIVRLEFVSGLEHFAKFGRGEGRAYRLSTQRQNVAPEQTTNAMLALSEHSRGATRLLSLPVDVVLQISTICNLRCVMCGHGIGAVENKRHMALQVVDSAAPFLSKAARIISSGMGEPLLAPAFWKFIAIYGKEPTVFIRANTNGDFLTRENAVRIMDSGLKEISFSLDAATPETYRKIRGGDYDKAIKGVSTMCEARRNHPRRSLEIFINMTLMCENISEAPAFVDLAKDLQVDGIIFGQLMKFGDQPTWIAQRDTWTFKYSEQMLRNVPDLARHYLTEAKVRAEKIGVKLIFLQNTHLFVSETGAAA